MTNPNAIAAAMMPLPQYAGAASAVIGFLYFVMASIGSSLSGYLLPGTVEGMLGIMTAFSIAALVVFVVLEVYLVRQTRREACVSGTREG
jgi:hypothetical protein